MAEAGPSRKRARTDEEPSIPDSSPTLSGASDTIPIPKKHESLWFEDGNVVLVASGTLAFKIYRGVLIRSSEVFRDMFAIPQPEFMETMDGCPLINVHDSALDLGHLLSALFERGYFDVTRCTIEILASILRLATKYSIDDLREEALTELGKCFPSNLASWDSAKTKRVRLIREPAAAVTVVNLAVDLSLEKHILHLALYECCQLPVRELLDGYRRSDGTAEKLDWTIMVLCIQGKETLTTSYYPFATNWMRTRRSECGNSHCLKLAKSFSQSFGVVPVPSARVLQGNALGEEYRAQLRSYCSSCRLLLLEDFLFHRGHAFRNLTEGSAFTFN
ncbi:hypothetical protein JAAARDRAFT_56859 [Jaapia argillacea MUCL 33604]|uniref:BTB domain-containing protein n=1 Tax=Jaapia argillacea MUCL 33604 TaxID=933084 RepID=A0A067PYR4_9AGAM|nr:hypothetical protein JAAARDRAFT_56859 [Jaapia argillacea MUCL 33604]